MFHTELASSQVSQNICCACSSNAQGHMASDWQNPQDGCYLIATHSQQHPTTSNDSKRHPMTSNDLALHLETLALHAYICAYPARGVQLRCCCCDCASVSLGVTGCRWASLDVVGCRWASLDMSLGIAGGADIQWHPPCQRCPAQCRLCYAGSPQSWHWLEGGLNCGSVIAWQHVGAHHCVPLGAAGGVGPTTSNSI